MANSVVAAFGVRGPKKNYPSTRFVLPDTFVGVEIELEPAIIDGSGMILYNSAFMQQNGWSVERDGSLRAGGLEFVLAAPSAGKALEQALTAFFSENGPREWAANERTSTHIHVDMSQEEDTDAVLRNTLAMYYVLEPGLMDLAGEGRKWCGYCNSFDDSDTTLLRAVMNGVRVRETFGRGRNRYFGANPRSLSSHGTLEIRIFPNPHNEEELFSWVNLVLELKKVAAAAAANDLTVEDEILRLGVRAMLEQYGATYLPRVLEFMPEDDVVYRAGVCLSLRNPRPRATPINMTSSIITNIIEKQAGLRRSGRETVAVPESPVDATRVLESYAARMNRMLSEPAITARAAPRVTTQPISREWLPYSTSNPFVSDSEESF